MVTQQELLRRQQAELLGQKQIPTAPTAPTPPTPPTTQELARLEEQERTKLAEEQRKELLKRAQSFEEKARMWKQKQQEEIAKGHEEYSERSEKRYEEKWIEAAEKAAGYRTALSYATGKYETGSLMSFAKSRATAELRRWEYKRGKAEEWGVAPSEYYAELQRRKEERRLAIPTKIPSVFDDKALFEYQVETFKKAGFTKSEAEIIAKESIRRQETPSIEEARRILETPEFLRAQPSPFDFVPITPEKEVVKPFEKPPLVMAPWTFGDKIAGYWRVAKERVVELGEGLPTISAVGYEPKPPPVIEKDVVPTDITDIGGTIQLGVPTIPELKGLGYYEAAAERELTQEQFNVQRDLDIKAEEIALRIGEELRSSGEVLVQNKLNMLQEQVARGTKTQKQAQKELNSFVSNYNKTTEKRFKSIFNRQMQPYISSAQKVIGGKVKTIQAKMIKAVDKRDMIPVFLGSAITAVGYGALAVLAPPVGAAIFGLSATSAFIQRKQIAEFAKQRPYTFGAGIAGMITGGIVGARVMGGIKGRIMQKSFLKAAKTAKIKVIGIEKTIDGKFVQAIIGATRIKGTDFIIKLTAAGTRTTRGALAIGKGAVLRLSGKGQLEGITGFETIGISKAVGVAKAVKVGDLLTAKQLIGRGFISKGAVRTTYNIELNPQVAVLGKPDFQIMGRGKIYPRPKFEVTPELAGVVKPLGQRISAFILGEKKPSFVTTKTDWGFVREPSKAKFDPRISGYLFSLKDTGKDLISLGKPSKATQVFQQQVSTIPQMLAGAGKQMIKAKIEPVVTTAPIVGTAPIISDLAKQQDKIVQGIVGTQVVKPRVKQRQDLSFRQVTKQIQQQRQEEKLVSPVALSSALLQEQAQKESLAFAQPQITKQIQKPKQRQPLITAFGFPSFVPPPVKVKVPPPPIRLPKMKEKTPRIITKPQGWNVYGKVIKTKKYKKLSKVPLTKQQAQSLGSYLVDTSLSTNFYIKPTTKKAKKPLIKFPTDYFSLTTKKFRDYRIRKGKRIPMENKWIERRGKPRLDTKQEVQKITLMKRLAQMKKVKTPKKVKKKSGKKKKRMKEPTITQKINSIFK